MTGIAFIDIALYRIIIFAIVLIANIIGTRYFAFFTTCIKIRSKNV